MGRCAVCQVECTLQCSNCKTVGLDARGPYPRGPYTAPPFYCGKEHQSEHWRSGHKKECGSVRHAKFIKALKRPRKPCDFLYKCVMDDILLDKNTQAYIDYGFVNCKNEDEECELLGVYIGLLKLLQCDLDELHEACMSNQLMKLITKEFSIRPPDYRGGYYPWLLANEHIVQNHYNNSTG